MSRKRHILAKLLFSAIACVLVCGVFASEIPEEITLTNDTSNDFVLRSQTILKSPQELGSARQDVWFFQSSPARDSSVQFSAFVFDDPSPVGQALFILHSALRR
jgi:hypothetical protein